MMLIIDKIKLHIQMKNTNPYWRDQTELQIPTIEANYWGLAIV